MSLIKAGETIEADFEEDPRYHIAVREAWIAFVYWVVYTVAVTGVAWSIGHGKSADEMNFILGFPDWFFWSAGVTTLIFCILPYFIIRYLFVNCSLLPDPNEAVTSEIESGDPDRPGKRLAGEDQ